MREGLLIHNMPKIKISPSLDYEVIYWTSCLSANDVRAKIIEKFPNKYITSSNDGKLLAIFNENQSCSIYATEGDLIFAAENFDSNNPEHKFFHNIIVMTVEECCHLLEEKINVGLS